MVLRMKELFEYLGFSMIGLAVLFVFASIIAIIMDIWRRTRHMLALFLCIGAVGLSGCASSPQTIAYKTLASVGNGVDSAEKAYLDLIVKGDIPTTSFVTVQKDYNTFQRDFAAALVIAEGSTNALAPASLVTESASFIAETSNLK